MTKEALIIFAKEPESGKVKTRLAQSLLDSQSAISIREAQEDAKNWYIKFCEAWNDKITELNHQDIYLFYQANQRASYSQLKAIFNQIPLNNFYEQSPSDLGGKMQDAFERAFAQGSTRVMIVGTDSPDLPLAEIKQGFKYLQKSPICIGPAEDGGYYTIGISKNENLNIIYQKLFQNMEWSTPSVYQETLKKLESIQVEAKELNYWYDIDSKKELDRFLAQS